MTRNATYRLPPYSRRVKWLGLSLVAILTAMWLLTAPKSVLALDPCVNAGYQLLENDPNHAGDYTNVCSPTLIPVSASRSNYSVTPGSVNLVNGCNAGLGTHSTWNDCVSGIKVWNLPTGFKLEIFLNSGYGSRIFCTDSPGDHTYDLSGGATNDRASSSRIVTGSC